MNRKPKQGGGRRRPPNDALIGRTEVARLLQCNRSTVCGYEKKGLLKPAIIEPDDVRWFEREAVQVLAAYFALKRRGSSAGRGRRGNAPPTSAPQTEGDYYPELRTRRLIEIPKPSVKVTSITQKRQTAREPVTLPRGIGPRTEILDEWWSDDLTSPAGDTPAREVDVVGATKTDAASPDDDSKASKK